MTYRKIILKHVTKHYGSFCALNDISLELNDGKIYGMVGRNGSGKTVLLKCISGLTPYDGGEIICDGRVLGKDFEAHRSLGVIIENPGFIPGWSGKRNLMFLSGINKRPSSSSVNEAISKVGLKEFSRKRVAVYSLGMRQRLGLAQAIMDSPDLMLLDEPLSGLDQKGLFSMRSLLKSYKSPGRIIVIASHNNEDIKELCDEVFYLDGGCVRMHESAR